MDGFPDWEVIVGFHNFLAGVTERAVAGKYAQAARLQEFLVRARSTAQDAGKAEGVSRPLSRVPFDADAQ